MQKQAKVDKVKTGNGNQSLLLAFGNGEGCQQILQLELVGVLAQNEGHDQHQH